MQDMPLTEKQKVVSQPLPNPPPIAVEKPLIELPSPQQLAWLMVRPVSSLETVDQQLLMYVCQEPIIDQVYKLAKDFAAMVGQRQVVLMNDWLASCQNCSVGLMQQFGTRHGGSGSSRTMPPYERPYLRNGVMVKPKVK